jgi:hypothetical protein
MIKTQKVPDYVKIPVVGAGEDYIEWLHIRPESDRITILSSESDYGIPRISAIMMKDIPGLIEGLQHVYAQHLEINKPDPETPVEKEGHKIPRTKEEAIDSLFARVREDDQQYIAGLKKEDLSALHHGLGRWIRNNFGLWAEDSELVELLKDKEKGQNYPHADDVSQILIEEFARQLREKYPHAEPASPWQNF